MTIEEFKSVRIGDIVEVMPLKEIQASDDANYLSNPPSHSPNRCNTTAIVVEICSDMSPGYEYFVLEYPDGFRWSWYAALLRLPQPIPATQFKDIMS